MHSSISIREEGPRGCGYRKVGGMYLVSKGFSSACGRLPIALHSCPCCGAGIRPARGWTWVSPVLITHDAPPCKYGHDAANCETCIVERLISQTQEPDYAMFKHLAGLLWVGEQFYPSVSDFVREADNLGISRRISAIPRGFVVGETPVMLGHRKGGIEWEIEDGVPHPVSVPAIFAIFVPEDIEVIVSGDESDEEIKDLLKRGLKPVIVKQLRPNEQLILEESRGGQNE